MPCETFTALSTNGPCVDAQEVANLYALVQNDINPQRIITQTLSDIPSLSRSMLLAWSDRILTS